MNKSILVAALLAVSLAVPAHAASFSSGSFRSSSFSRPSSPAHYSYRPTPSVAPKAAPKAAPVVVQKNVTVQQNVTHVTQSSGSSGGGFMSSMFGSFAGAGIANYLFGPKAAPAPAPTQQVDCTLPQNKPLAICQPAQ